MSEQTRLYSIDRKYEEIERQSDEQHRAWLEESRAKDESSKRGRLIAGTQEWFPVE